MLVQKVLRGWVSKESAGGCNRGEFKKKMVKDRNPCRVPFDILHRQIQERLPMYPSCIVDQNRWRPQLGSKT